MDQPCQNGKGSLQ